jgi:hypothetical protein
MMTRAVVVALCVVAPCVVALPAAAKPPALAPFERGKIGYIDRLGHITIAPRFDFALPFESGRAAFCIGCKLVRHGEHSTVEGGAWGVIDRAGQELLAATRDSAEDALRSVPAKSSAHRAAGR